MQKGTIPASTGEPCARWSRRRYSEDYPREHGGTALFQGRLDCLRGLSPRARGNQYRQPATGETIGTIPASTGEPTVPRRRTRPAVDYPREHGGTTLIALDFHNGPGLSPRARGNRKAAEALGPVERTIPASTGEPGHMMSASVESRDYPREHGGTSTAGSILSMSRGLSPRARGNPLGPGLGYADAGTIPASTGEPSWHWCP